MRENQSKSASNEMVLAKSSVLKSESGNLIKDATLIRNRIRQNEVEGRKDDQLTTIE